MIDRDHALPITRQASLLGMSRGSVYYLPRATSEADLELMRRIDELHLEFPFMGARMLRRQLHRQGVEVGRRHIVTLMRRMSIEALAPQPGTSKRAPGHKVYPYLLRKLAIERSNQVWALDTTYIPMARGFVYLTAVVDVASRRVLAHKVAITLEACHAREVIEQAFARWGTPEIVNTDQGSQFTLGQIDLGRSHGSDNNRRRGERTGCCVEVDAVSGIGRNGAVRRRTGREAHIDQQVTRVARGQGRDHHELHTRAAAATEVGRDIDGRDIAGRTRRNRRHVLHFDRQQIKRPGRQCTARWCLSSCR
jgi:putative transposase